MKAEIKGNWLSRHLNWTLFLYVVVLPVPIVALYAYLVVPEPEIDLLFYVLLVFGLLYWQIIVAVWYLRNKNRSLWNIIWSFTSIIGLTVLLFLRNENTSGRYYNLLYEDSHGVKGKP